jgi:transposase
MQAPILLRTLTEDERLALEAGLRSSVSFTMRRCQLLLATADGQATSAIARIFHCNDQTVRNAIHDFHQRSLAALQPKSSRPHSVHPIFNDQGCQELRALLHQSPRTFDKPTSIWTLQLAAEVSYAKGITPYQVSDETIRQALRQLKVSWKRAKHWITSPDPEYLRKKNGVTG